VQTTLDVGGCFPLIGEGCDVANALISLARGDYVGAGLSLLSVIPLYGDAAGKGGKLARRAAKYADEAAAAARGQLHHAISKRVHDALQNHPVLRDAYRRRDPRLVTRAADKQAHYGYQRWHVELDAEVVKWIEDNKKATVGEFEKFLRELYDRPDMKKRFPEGLPK
jgi:hypothetical protein